MLVNKEDNPLPGFMDPITCDEIERPALALHGIVLGYSTWMRCMPQGTGVCPLTKRPVTRRELILLSKENIEEYRSRIVNWS